MGYSIDTVYFLLHGFPACKTENSKAQVLWAMLSASCFSLLNFELKAGR